MQLTRYEVVVPGRSPLFVWAYTKGEARAMAKRLFGVRQLPPGTLAIEAHQIDGPPANPRHLIPIEEGRAPKAQVPTPA